MKSALNLPNQITLGRFVLAVVFVALLSQYSQQDPQRGLLDLAAAIFVVAALTDFLDGYMARRRGQVTVLGRILDPLVDKVLVCGAFILFAGQPFVDESGRNVTHVSAWMVVVIVGRELLVTGLRGFSESVGQSYGASVYGKIKMWMQSIAAPAILLIVAHEAEWSLGGSAETIKKALVWITVAVTALSMLSYLVRSRTLLEEGRSA
ncbi:MAG: CDP-diacylglycerol--glycerol-3-phosphate 3-phosphatidyltransferase [Planctomycetota bacterium]|nr:MAG: CDP-diacylglycerol--glycerol-3-phosphate 3-phosphatidyltransferase [Planctomycetota bacterium]